MHHPQILILDGAAAGAQLLEEHGDRLQDVERLEPGDNDRQAVALRNPAIGMGPDHGRDVTRTDETVEPHVGRVENGLDRRQNRDVVAEHGEVQQSLVPRAEHGDGGGRRGGLEADGEEDDVAVGVADGELQGVERRIDHPHVGAGRLGIEQALAASGHLHHVAVGREDHAPLGDRDRVVHPPHGDDAHRASGAVHQLDAIRQELIEAVLVDRVRVPAAHLHELAPVPGGELLDAPQEGGDQSRIAVLVDVFHASKRAWRR